MNCDEIMSISNSNFSQEELWGNNNSNPNQTQRLSREVKEITALYNIGVVVGSSLDLKDVIWGLYKESGRLVNTSNFAIIIYDEETNTLNYVLVFDQGEKMQPSSIKLVHDSGGLIETVLTTQTPRLIHDLPEDGDELPATYLFVIYVFSLGGLNCSRGSHPSQRANGQEQAMV